MKRNKGMIVLFLAPAVLMFSIIFLYPIVRTIIMSFFKIDGITDPVSKWQFTGLSNFIKLANTSLFRISMWNLFRIWFIGGLIVMSLALLSSLPAESVLKVFSVQLSIFPTLSVLSLWLLCGCNMFTVQNSDF